MKPSDIFCMFIIAIGFIILCVVFSPKPALNAPSLEQRVRELEARVRVLEGQSKSTNLYMPVGRRTYGTKQTT